jgi:ABC-type dipeptide/oligopeptide/nickel transport system permease subunit
LPDTEPGTQAGAQEPEFLAAESARGTVIAAPIPGANVGTEADEMAAPSRGQLRMAARRFVRHKMAMSGAIIFLVLLLGSIIVPIFWQYSYSSITNSFATGPSAAHPFGTDLIGHDMLAQVMAGTLTSMEVALLVAAISTVIGTAIGALAGYYGGIIDQALMRLTDLVLVVPLLAILLVLSNKFSKQADSQLFVALLLALLFWTYLARLIRGTFLSLREREFIEAEHAIGASTWRIILRHMVPNAAGSIVVNATLTVAGAILIEASLSFLGLGIQPPQVDLGSLIASGEGDATTLPWLFYFPAGFLVLAILAVNFIGDGLRDALDPTQRGR